MSTILLYFVGIAVYSLVPDKCFIPKIIQNVFYWANNTALMFNITYIFSKFVVERKIKVLLIGTSIFFLILGIFQVLVCLGFSFGKFWAFFCPVYILFLLIVIKYVSNKLS